MTTAQDVQRLYIAYFGRPADPVGLQYWTNQLSTNRETIEGIANNFALSPEYSSNFTGLTPSQIVTAIYQNLFGRQPDTEGLFYWAGELTAGTQSIGKIALTIATAARDDATAGTFDATTLTAKIQASVNFTDAIDTVDEINGYSGATANALAKAYVAGVVDASTLTSATAALSATVATVVAAGGPPGQTYVLTQGLDTITGTVGNDVINAYAFNSVSGADTTTLQSVDTINGGAGTDTLNIEVKDNGSGSDYNDSIQGTISNVEIININNTGALLAGSINASLLGAAAQQIWQIGKEAGVSELAATTTAGFRNITTVQTFDVAPADAAGKATVAFDNVAEGSTLNVVATSTGTLNSVKVSGSVANTNVAVTVGEDVQTLFLDSAVATSLSITNGSGTKVITAIDAGASTGAITYADSETGVATITTGAGDDDVTLVTTTSKTTGSVVNASVVTNAGDDSVTVNVTGDGNTSVSTGDGDDTVSISGRDTSVLTVNLGAGSDTFTSSVAIQSTDSIDAGAGVDTLLLSLVGANNVSAFKNFDVYDVNGLNNNLDLDILNTNNTVTEIIGSGALTSSSTLQNLGTGVNFRATADLDITNILTLVQKTAGALTVTLDADQTSNPSGDDVASVSVAATGATSISAVFDTAYIGAAGSGTSETATIVLATQSAASINVVSGGANSANVLTVTEGAGTDALKAVTVTGAQALTLSVTGASKLATIDSSAATGSLITSLANVIDGGVIKLGSGVDTITVTSVSTTGGIESIVGFEKAAAAAVGTAGAAATAAIADADTLHITDALVASPSAVTGGDVNSKGVLVFSGAGPTTLDGAISIANLAAETNGEAVVFQYLSDSYVFVQDATDIVVRLTGIAGITNLAENGTTDNFFIV